MAGWGRDFSFAAVIKTLLFLYNIFIRAYHLLLSMASLWNPKAKAWIEGRKDLFPHLETGRDENPCIWFHCSSAGEFEQAIPVLEALKAAYPGYTMVVTFFSPSGMKAAEKYKSLYRMAYLPLDTAHNARQFLSIVQPRLTIFVKYEFWYHHLAQAKKQGIPLLLISASFRPGQLFFKPYGRFYKKMLHFFDHIFVQDQSSLDLLVSHGINKASISGDTRFDRVTAIASGVQQVPYIAAFIGDSPVIVAGSTWEEDEAYLAPYARENPGVKLIIAPHEINKAHLLSLTKLFPGAYMYSSLVYEHKVLPIAPHGSSEQTAINAPLQKLQVLIIDSIGLLSQLYRYATIAYVGGGFTKDGVHNMLEAAVYAKPIVIGRNYSKYKEAIDLVNNGAAFSIASATELQSTINELLQHAEKREVSAKASGKYILENTGAAARIIHYIQEKRLLTRL